MYTLSLSKIPDLIQHIANEMPVFGYFESSKNTLSYKSFFLPAIEKLYETVKDKKGYTITPTVPIDTPFALIGVRACDSKAIDILDSVYLSDPIDPLYQQRREMACIITMACEKPWATCFCTSVGIDPINPGGDISTWQQEGTLFWLPQTQKGKDITEKLLHLLEETTLPTFAPFVPIASVPTPLPLPTDMATAFNAKSWDTLHQICVACGTCTFVCPTCQCYDIADVEITGKTHCMRHWDACLYASFTQMAHGNPRPSKKERFRQRYMHKLVYHPQKYGESACVGCGRCVNACPVNMNIVTVARALQQESEVQDV